VNTILDCGYEKKEERLHLTAGEVYRSARPTQIYP
jgi:hypothetical protein